MSFTVRMYLVSLQAVNSLKSVEFLMLNCYRKICIIPGTLQQLWLDDTAEVKETDWLIDWQATYTVSTMTCCDCSSTVVSRQRATICSSVTTSTAANSHWRPSVCYSPTRSNIRRTSSCCVATMSVPASTVSTASTMSVHTCVICSSVYHYHLWLPVTCNIGRCQSPNHATTAEHIPTQPSSAMVGIGICIDSKFWGGDGDGRRILSRN